MNFLFLPLIVLIFVVSWLLAGFILERIKDAITLNKQLHLQHNGRPDCKNCNLMEVVEEILEKETTTKQ